MPEANISGGLKVDSEVAIRNAQQRMVVKFDSKGMRWYDKWRITWCSTHRDTWTMPGFRTGKINPFTLGFALIVRFQEVLHGSRR
jgi:hypothetical protein